MDSKSARSGDIGNLQRAAQGIEEQPGTQTPALPVAVHGEPRQNENAACGGGTLSVAMEL